MSSREPRRVSSKTHTLDVLHEISGLLSTDLDKEALAICVSLIENGVNPEALASVVKDLRSARTKIASREEALRK